MTMRIGDGKTLHFLIDVDCLSGSILLVHDSNLAFAKGGPYGMRILGAGKALTDSAKGQMPGRDVNEDERWVKYFGAWTALFNAYAAFVFYIGMTLRGDVRISEHLVPLRYYDANGASNKVNKRMTYFAGEGPLRCGFHFLIVVVTELQGNAEWSVSRILRLGEVYSPIIFFAENVVQRFTGAAELARGGLNVRTLDRWASPDSEPLSEAVVVEMWEQMRRWSLRGRTLPGHRDQAKKLWSRVFDGSMPKARDGREISPWTACREHITLQVVYKDHGAAGSVTYPRDEEEEAQEKEEEEENGRGGATRWEHPPPRRQWESALCENEHYRHPCGGGRCTRARQARCCVRVSP
ncbi:hypothetical protein K438DRAFT_1750001 [Mycena galopus ATCC 62051]|nr:hypothetical protein K438DRAFT_1750001 [Mycena galopus ATCC 62051]